MTDDPETTSPEPASEQSVEVRLEQILLEAEESLRGLREELAEQRRFARQHQEVDRLSEHLAQTSHKWSGVKIFLDDLVADFRRMRSPADDESPRPADGPPQDRS